PGRLVVSSALGPGARPRPGERRAVHGENVVDGAGHLALDGAGADLVVHEVDRAAGGRVAVDRVPLTVDGRVRDAGVAADERRALVVRPGRAEISEREVVEVQVPRAVDPELGVAAARA